MTSIKDELDALKSERAEWEQRVSLLRPDRIDPDMLEERGAPCSTMSIRATLLCCLSRVSSETNLPAGIQPPDALPIFFVLEATPPVRFRRAAI